MKKHRVNLIHTGESSERFDKLLLDQVHELGLTRSRIKTLIEERRVSVRGVVVIKAGFEVRPGESFEVEIDLPPPPQVSPLEIPLQVLFEDDEILAINKPAGLVVHEGAGTQGVTVVNALAHYFGNRLPETFQGNEEVRPGIVHRLDKDTSGVLLIAKTLRAQSGLSTLIQERKIEKHYEALVLSTPRRLRPLEQVDEGTITLPLGRHPTQKTLMAVVPQGREAITHWKVRERLSYAAHLDLQIVTGRTHQIRVHLAYYGSPVLGDTVYGEFSSLPKPLAQKVAGLGRFALHAKMIRFLHPISQLPVHIEAAFPDELQKLRDAFAG